MAIKNYIKTKPAKKRNKQWYVGKVDIVQYWKHFNVSACFKMC